MNYLETTLAQLACDIPGATRIFHKYKLDFCCGGKKSLADSIEGRNFTAEEIIADLDAVSQLQSESGDKTHLQSSLNIFCNVIMMFIAFSSLN